MKNSCGRDLVLLGSDTWLRIYHDSLSILGPYSHCGSIPELLEATARDSSYFIKELSQTPSLEPLCCVAETLFSALCWKKWRFADPKLASVRKESALDGFLERNARASSLPMPDSITRAKMRELLDRWLPFQGFPPGHFGPGAVCEHWTHARRWEVLTPFLTRCYRELPLSREVVSQNEDSYLLLLPGEESLVRTSHSRLCAVPKDWNKDRLITVEPAVRSFLQQQVRSAICTSIHRGPLKGTAMDPFSDGQLIQRRLALSGSISGETATLDLSDASDNITADLVFDVVPFWLGCALEQCRTPSFECRGRTYTMHIYAGMGNATTFLVETLIFAAYCEAIKWRHGIRGRRASVFGDDIIVDRRLAEILVNESDEFFRVNPDKSFYRIEDHLRESCGIYAYEGIDVTPARFNGFPKTFQGTLGLCDYIRQKGNSHLPYQVRLAYLIGEAALAHGIPNWPFEVEGYPAFCLAGLPFCEPPEIRRNQDYQVLEAKVEIAEPDFVSVPAATCPWAAQAALSGYLTTTPTRKGAILKFPLRDTFRKPRKRWRRIIPTELM